MYQKWSVLKKKKKNKYNTAILVCPGYMGLEIYKWADYSY